MEQLEFKILDAGIALNTTETKLKMSLAEIIEKHPKREDLIKSMDESLDDVHKIQAVFHWLREKRETYEIDMHKMQQENDNLNWEIKKLRKELQDIKNNLSI